MLSISLCRPIFSPQTLRSFQWCWSTTVRQSAAVSVVLLTRQACLLLYTVYIYFITNMFAGKIKKKNPRLLPAQQLIKSYCAPQSNFDFSCSFCKFSDQACINGRPTFRVKLGSVETELIVFHPTFYDSLIMTNCVDYRSR